MVPPLFDIRIRNQAQGASLPLPYFKAAVRAILKILKQKNVAVSILFVGDRRMQFFNRHYLKHDRTTDVIAFPAGTQVRERSRRLYFLGDILISVPTARRQARVYGNPLNYELCFYLCHGILHLMGYRDKTQKEAIRMQRLQQKILKQIGV